MKQKSLQSICRIFLLVLTMPQSIISGFTQKAVSLVMGQSWEGQRKKMERRKSSLDI